MKSAGMLIIVILFLCGTAYADRNVWYVHPDSALNTIQAGLDSCADNDIVLVGPGIYYENIAWPNTQGIHLTSELGVESTVIDGGGAGTVITCTSSVHTTTIIRGFTITNGHNAYEAGIFCAGASPTICDNVVTGNVCDSLYGYAVYVSDGAPTIVRNMVATNVGGGIGVENGCDSAIIDTNIVEFNTGNGIYVNSIYSVRNNTVTHNGCLGIYFYRNLYHHFTGNIISNNTESGLYFAPGFSQDSDPAGYRNDRSSGSNIISYNGEYGIGGFDADGYKHSTIEHNGAGGIRTYFLGNIDSCTVTNNYGPGITVLGMVGATDLDTMHVHYCNIYGNVGYGILNVLDPDTFLVSAENIWWGSATGPYHPTANPSGLGDTVSDYVSFDPWLYDPWGIEEEPIGRPVGEYGNLTATIFRGPLQLPEGKECKVYDITGRVVEPSKIQPGIYFIEVDGVVTQKVVKIR